MAALVIAPLSYFYSFVVLFSIWRELRVAPEAWTKIERLPAGAAARRGGLSLALLGILMVGLVTGLQFSTSRIALKASRTLGTPPGPHARADLAIATHFDAWDNWHKAISSVLGSPEVRLIHTAGISAGRPEWAHFRWKGHQAEWSSEQRNESDDILELAASSFRQHGIHSVAIVDVYAPRRLAEHPEMAAVRFDGVRSNEQVCFTELVDGEYGNQVLAMVSYLAHNYPVDAIALTELGYSSSCFDDRCLASYRGETNKPWPRTGGEVVADPNDPSIWEWRSSRMETFLARVANVVHAEGKKLLVDVPVDWKDLSREGKDFGLDYHRVLRNADQIVVWDYLGVEGKPAQTSEKLAAMLRREFPPDRVVMSIGLWARHGTLAPAELQQGLDSTLKGGISNVWITPNHLLTAEHWRVIGESLVDANETQRN